MAATQTHTVTASWQSGTGFWVAANGIIGSLKADVLLPVGTAIRVVHGRAVKA